MTVTSTKATVSYLGNGQTTAFDFDFLVPSGALLVLVDGLEVTTGFTASGLDSASGGSVSFASAPASGVSITISRAVSLTQERAFVNGQAIYAKEIEGALDKLTMAAQALQDGVERAVKVPVGSSESADTLVSSLIEASASAVEGAASAATAQTAAEDAAAIAEAAAARISSVLDYIPTELHAAIRDGTNTTDLTAYIQAALDAGEGHFPLGAYDIYAGLVNAAAVIRMEAGARIRPNGAGYTALTINGQFSYTKGWKIFITNDWNPFTGNGVWWTNPAACEIDSIKVYAVTGFGVKFEMMWDCTVNSVSAVLCGSAGNEYAFQILDGGGTSNQSTFSHIQVELSGPKAIYIAPNTRHCVFTQIHSERTYAEGSTVCHFLGGGWCTYSNVRIANHGNVGSAGVVVVQAAETAFHQLYLETDTPCEIAGYTGGNVSFYDGHFTGVVYSSNNQTGTFKFERCRFFAELSPDTSGGYAFSDCDIASLTLGYIYHASSGDYIADVRSNALRRRFDACRIATVQSNSTTAAANFVSCTIDSTNSVPYYQIYEGCTIKGGTVTVTAGAFLEMRNCRLVGNIVFGFNAQGWMRDCVVLGSASTDGSAQQNCAYVNVALSGTAGAGMNGPPTYGTWVHGERCDRLVPEVGQPTGWVYLAGSGWTALATL